MDRLLNNRMVVLWAVAIFSGLLSLYRIATRDLINGDGISYIELARVFLDKGFGAAIDVYHWPFSSILIGLVHRLTGLSFENSASLLNTFFMMIVCVAFVRIYAEISGREGRIWVAAILILALPVLNDYRDLVIRGYGFWAFMLVALHGFIQYSRSPGIRSALKWQLAIAAATLFRIEGVVFLVLAPFCFLFIAGERRRMVSHAVRLNSLFILLVIAVAAVLLVSGVVTLSFSTVMPYQLAYISPMALMGAIDAEAGMMFARNKFMSSVGDARLILASGVLTLVLVKVVTNAGLPFLAVWSYGVHRKWLQLTRESWIVTYFACIGVLVLFPVAGNYFFLSSRYTVLAVLLISLITFQYVDCLFRELSRCRLRKWTMTAWIFILILFLDGVISGGTSKHNIRVAAEWVKAEITAEKKIACNEARLEFYSDGRCKWVVVSSAGTLDTIYDLKKEGYDYFLFWLGRKDERLRSAVEGDAALVLVKEFPNKRGDNVRLYSVKQAR